MWFLLKKKWFWLTLLVVFLGNIVWPVKEMFFSRFLFQNHLLVLTNEAELRPCGGFVTAYGQLRFIPPKLELKNVYSLKNADFGEALSPINRVSDRLRFWDLGTTPDLSQCSQNFLEAAKSIDLEIDDVVLVDLSSIEKVSKNDQLFAEMTRQVANIDRHSEKELKSRKKTLVETGQKIFLQIMLRPWEWGKISRDLAAKIKNGNIFISKFSPEIKPKKDDLAVYEWNLGGGKSSRFLAKSLNLNFREISPNNWQIRGEIGANHLGQYDEPLSQNWQGMIEVVFPKKFDQKPLSFELSLAPGQKWKESFAFDYQGKISDFSLFNPRGQKIFLDWKISLYGQQFFSDANFKSHENTGYVYKEATKFREKFVWRNNYDQVRPFVTLHEWTENRDIIPEENLAKWSDFFKVEDSNFRFAEIHFSEPVFLSEKTKIEVIDQDFENREVSEDLEFEEIILFDDHITALVGFWQKERQINERFYLKFRGILDTFGNEISDQNYTIIDRENS